MFFSFFKEVAFLDFLALHIKGKMCDQMGPTPFYLQSKVVSACQILGIAPFFFSSGSIIFGFF